MCKNNAYKIIATDMDNTLFGPDYTVSARNKEAIKAASQEGIYVVLSSGRSMASVKRYAEELEIPEGGFVSTLNGAQVYRLWEKEPVLDLRLPVEAARLALSISARFDVQPVVYTDAYHLLIDKRTKYSDAYISVSLAEPSYVGADLGGALPGDVSKIILLGEHDELARMERYVLSEYGGSGKFGIVFSAKHLLEFLSPEATKGNGLKFIADLLGIGIEETIAIGDQENDESMVAAAGLGVAVMNARQSVKDIAGYITENDCLHSCVADVIEKFALSRRPY